MNELNHFQKEFEAFEMYMEDVGYADTTIRHYRYDVLMFFRFIYNRKIDINEVTKLDILAFFRSLKMAGAKGQVKEGQASSRNRRLMSLRLFFKALTKYELMNHNPALDVDAARQSKERLPLFLNEHELAGLIQSVSEDQFTARNRLVIKLMAFAGLRVLEVHRLDSMDIDREQGGLTIYGKGGKTRYVPLKSSLFQELLEFEKNNQAIQRQAKAFFVSTRGQRLSIRMIQQITKNALEQLKKDPAFHYLEGKKLSAHKLRHTFGTSLVQKGADIRIVQELLGHENINTTQIYTHVTSEQKRKAIALFD
ncbi:tyrosine-type recombinase/integrase [Jeotgalibacillus soli]|uniref:Integrase n=1 Tax=Jeotgalibacillus soli TaxID=889306 RepID=A0A0C2RUL4_9BACL|nr:tyrosine-type recombinase/integrase [Jeotgalibacillus soli]KIL45434.1 hypothetical protein KP78_29780 [Jeotgalibacillus soli]